MEKPSNSPMLTCVIVFDVVNRCGGANASEHDSIMAASSTTAREIEQLVIMVRLIKSLCMILAAFVSVLSSDMALQQHPRDELVFFTMVFPQIFSFFPFLTCSSTVNTSYNYCHFSYCQSRTLKLQSKNLRRLCLIVSAVNKQASSGSCYTLHD